MAVVLDINILCNKMLDLNMVESFFTKHNVSIESINSIDNWMWDNEKKLEDFSHIATILERQQIIIFKLKQPTFKDMGIYVEKLENQFLYTVWVNTEGYAMLDCEKITMDNYTFYKKIIEMLLELNGLVENFFEVVGIGLETDFYYEKNVIGIIRKSRNMMIWVLNNHNNLNIQLENFRSNMIKDVYVLQKE